MIRHFWLTMLCCVMACADSSPDPQEVLENSRKVTAEAEQVIEQARKSLDESKTKIDSMQQNSPEPAESK